MINDIINELTNAINNGGIITESLADDLLADLGMAGGDLDPTCIALANLIQALVSDSINR